MIPPPIFSFFPKPIKPLDQPQQLIIKESTTTVEVQGDDYFDLLPDPIVGVILNNLLDAKSLCRCLVVSKRIASLVPQVDSVSVVANPTLSSSNLSLASPPPKKSFSKTFLRSLFSKLLKSSKKSAPASNFIGPGDLSNWIRNSVNNFPEIRHLRVELPDNGGIVGFPDTGGLLKWSAEFGRELQRCAIIGATSFEKKKPTPDQIENQNKNENGNNNNLLTDEELRARVVWILSCLISACARHGVARKTVLECSDLRSAEIVDAMRQGRLTMSEDQIKEMREVKEKDLESEGEPIWKRTTVPNVIVKLWYAPELVLPESGWVMKGATVVAIRPDTGRAEEVVEKEYELLKGGFGGDVEEEEVIAEAVREIVKSKWKLMYKLQMNSF